MPFSSSLPVRTLLPNRTGVCLALASAVLLVFGGCGDSTAGVEGSFYLREIHGADLRVRDMTPTALVPHHCELSSRCPANLELIETEPLTSGLIGQYLAALDLERPGLPAIASGTLAQFRQVLRRVHTEISTRVKSDPDEKLFALVKHYPHPTAGSDFQVIHTSFYTIADVFLTPVRIEAEKSDGARMEGTLLEVRATYRIVKDEAKLVEAMIEASDDVRMQGHRLGLPALHAGDEIPKVLRSDEFWGGHFYDFGAGLRIGLYWCDQSLGEGAVSPWACAYRIEPLGVGRPQVDPLAEDARRWLLDVARAN